MTEEDLIEKWEQYADDLGSRFSDDYSLDEAINDYHKFGYEWILIQFMILKDTIEIEDEILREEQDMIDFERDY